MKEIYNLILRIHLMYQKVCFEKISRILLRIVSENLSLNIRVHPRQNRQTRYLTSLDRQRQS